MSPQAQLKWNEITTWLLRIGVFLMSIIFTLALNMFRDTKQDVEQIKKDVNLILQYRAGDVEKINSNRRDIDNLQGDIRRLDRFHENSKQ